jgi:anti-sigma regulatory factor (Ser/Thr protein kinase)
MCTTTEAARVLLPMSTRSPAAARQFARISGCTEHTSQALDEALLLISELVTNSVLHGGPQITLAIECDGTGIRVRVRDGASGLPEPHLSADDEERGRGLRLVGLLADSWGVESVEDEHGCGKAVWFVISAEGCRTLGPPRLAH